MDDSTPILVCEKIVGILRGALCPDLITSGDSIGVCTPSEKGDFALGVNCLDIQPSADMPSTGLSPLGNSVAAFPDCHADTYLLITSYSTADIKYRAAADINIIGHVCRVLADTPLLTVTQDGETIEVPLLMLSTPMDQKMKLWVYPDTPYRLSLLYRAGPLPFRSSRMAGISRVWGGSAGG